MQCLYIPKRILVSQISHPTPVLAKDKLSDMDTKMKRKKENTDFPGAGKANIAALMIIPKLENKA